MEQLTIDTSWVAERSGGNPPVRQAGLPAGQAGNLQPRSKELQQHNGKAEDSSLWSE
ncbi:hypothetical protein [Sinomicrobium soli]|uniref:hypothetical protein n=1 Tax=Sinomicrobium sp. N-1-3-6 TaxID=2219864 RepID=UPI001374C28B|nr:hypothetical protein [Sinomicrobium sp. N-1-3-6]